MRPNENRPAGNGAVHQKVDQTDTSVTRMASMVGGAGTLPTGIATDTNRYPSFGAVPVAVPVAAAQLYPATGRRHLNVAVVTRCPHCLRSHLHRGRDLDGAPKVSGCNPGRPYILAVVA